MYGSTFLFTVHYFGVGVSLTFPPQFSILIFFSTELLLLHSTEENIELSLPSLTSAAEGLLEELLEKLIMFWDGVNVGSSQGSVITGSAEMK